MSTILACLILGTVPLAPVVEDHCDVLERNRVFNGEGVEVLDQIVAYDWTPTAGYVVCWWRLVRPGMLPTGGACVWLDGGTLRRVRYASYRQTWTTHDPELIQRDVWPCCERRELSR